MQPFRRPSRRAAYQPKEPKPAPRSIPDQALNELFAALDRNRIGLWSRPNSSTCARATELLGVCQDLVVPEEQVIGVVCKGSRAPGNNRGEVPWSPPTALPRRVATTRRSSSASGLGRAIGSRPSRSRMSLSC